MMAAFVSDAMPMVYQRWQKVFLSKSSGGRAAREDDDSKGSHKMVAGDSNSGRRWWQQKMTVTVDEDGSRESHTT
ncbi:hypothetical protein CEXT_431931 [Caerostris extrusa]|uniref:Uncharacterized protein n=1 Tax=Caerostris extrusa TaxID=172846 RepID=A0AAV4MY84_CAEEX|nr:hypothetical protein CEXT_431931 [Caerostris extrusa]